ncbi:hypothetical protein [Frigoribacterium faeni]|uniref:Uncharacterized protein n=1 Tax=Frigoribacterium faeni TaxID=145483 RepID=A0A7W3PJW4_9MICO|nr:hypothetical protein [Frigoribacterium faeni]MBA8814212.1 hypothetical protein [Frigoribacterium faeni]
MPGQIDDGRCQRPRPQVGEHAERLLAGELHADEPLRVDPHVERLGRPTDGAVLPLGPLDEESAVEERLAQPSEAGGRQPQAATEVGPGDRTVDQHLSGELATRVAESRTRRRHRASISSAANRNTIEIGSNTARRPARAILTERLTAPFLSS